MSGRKLLSRQLIGLVAAGAACFVPSPWICLPGLAVLLFWLPGRAILQLLRPLRMQPGCTWCGLAASLAVMPVLLHWVWQVSNHRSVLLGAILLFDILLVLAAGVRGSAAVATSPIFDNQWQRRIFAALIAWIAVWVFLFYWVPAAGGRLVPSPSGDFIKHHALLWSLERYPLPLHNVFYAAESNTPYYYYEQFHLLPATLWIVSGGSVSNELCFGAVAALVVATCVAMVMLLARGVLGSNMGALMAAACASIVGGWDVVPCAIIFITTGRPTIVLDSWCPVTWRTHNLMNSFVWCPQQVLALTTLLLCCHWLQIDPRRRWWIVVGPVAAASIFGSSVYMALFAFAGAGLYLLLDLWRQVRLNPSRARSLFMCLMAMLPIGVVLMGQTALHYREMGIRFGGGATTHWERFPFAVLGKCVPPGVLANWLEAPWLVPVEFGIMGLAWLLVAPVVWRRLWQDSGTRLLVIAGAIGLGALWTVRSDINRYDYCFRMGSLITFVVGSICVGAMLDPAHVRPLFRRWRRHILMSGIVLGLPVGLYEPPVAAVRTLFEKIPELADRGAIRFVRQLTPADAVVQPEPANQSRLVQLFDRQVGVMTPDSHVNVLRPRDAAKMMLGVGDVKAAFATEDSVRAFDLFARWGITYVFAGDREHKLFGKLPQLADPIWFEIVYDDGYAAVYRLKRLGTRN